MYKLILLMCRASRGVIHESPPAIFSLGTAKLSRNKLVLHRRTFRGDLFALCKISKCENFLEIPNSPEENLYKSQTKFGQVIREAVVNKAATDCSGPETSPRAGQHVGNIFR